MHARGPPVRARNPAGTAFRADSRAARHATRMVNPTNRARPPRLAALAAALALAPSFANAADTDWSQANDPAAAKSSESLAQLRAQVLLDRAHFSPGEIDALEGSNVKRALTAFQSARGLEASGALDDATWAALDADAAPALVEYTIAEADVAGPFVEIPEDMMEKASLERMGYASALE